MSKSKQIAFKNPFDLIEQEEEPMSMPTNTHRPRNQQLTVHNPLPFNPYQIKKEEMIEKKEVKTQVKNKNIIAPMTYVSPQPEQNVGFKSPFGVSENNPNPIPLYIQPNQQRANEVQPPKQYVLDDNGDPPLLDDIGIQPQKIKQRIILVLKVSQPTYDMIHDPDLSGPIFIALTLGCLLLLSGKVHFGDIYAMFILGNFLLYFLLNYMSQIDQIPLYNIMSTLGYGLLPMLTLGFLNIFFNLRAGVGIILALSIALWSSFSAANFIDVLIKDTKERKMLIVYPLFLFYISFTMIVIF